MPETSAIVDFATSRHRSRLAAAESKRRVHIWDVLAGAHLETLETVFGFGGSRLAISDDGEYLYAASFHSPGLAAYNIRTREVMWQRRDLREIQTVTLLADTHQLFVGLDRRASQLLDPSSGATIEALRGAKKITVSRFGPFRFVDGVRPGVNTTAGDLVTRTHRLTFAFIGVAFGPDSFVVSDTTGPVRCFDLASASELWRQRFPPGHHAVELEYVAAAHAFAAVEFRYNIDAHRALSLLDADTGARTPVLQLGHISAAAFCLDGEGVITSEGDLFSTTTGVIVRHLDFPRRASDA